MQLKTYLRAKELAEYQAIELWSDAEFGTKAEELYHRRQRQAKEFTRRIIRISARSLRRIVDLESENARLRRQLEAIRDLARTGLKPDAFDYTEEQWLAHKLNKCARIADDALQAGGEDAETRAGMREMRGEE